MTSLQHLRRTIVVFGIALTIALIGFASVPASGAHATKPQTQAIPTALNVPSGNVLSAKTLGIGFQVYTCQVSTTSNEYAWVFLQPEAVLLDTANRRFFGTHYAGPTWQARDGSTVVGTRQAGVTVDTQAIPWLLLSGTAHTGTGQLSNVTYIQRLNTTGGLAPTTGCDAAHDGAKYSSFYTANYLFYSAK